MPLDNTNYQQDEKQKARDRGYQLVYALRHLPETHRWNFMYVFHQEECGTAGCAIGLAHTLWPEFEMAKINDERTHIFWSKSEEILGVSESAAYDMFSTSRAYECHLMTEVTPEMVADKLEEYLNNAG